MSRIDDLIRDLCPHGVEHKPLGEVGRLLGGLTGKTKADFVDGTTRYVSYKNVYSNLEVDVTADDFVRISDSETQNALQIGDILFTISSENREEIGLTSVVTSLPPEPLYLNSFCACFRPNENFTLIPEFAKHLFRSGAIRHQVIKTATGVTRINISRKNLVKIQVPLPPTEVQQEVARILDQFTQLEAELEAELEARRQQYSHFANSITHSEHAITLGNIATFDYGLTAKAKDTGTHRFIRITDISPSGWLLPNNAKYVDITPDSNRFIVNDQDILVARTGASYGKTLLVRSENPMSFASYLIRINLNPLQIDPEFYWHFTHSRDYWKQAASLVSKGGQQQFNSNALKRIKTPIPPLAQQREIAKSLNHLHSLAHDLTSGLPAEIEARRKQYEYYRDRLLAFPEKK